MSDGIEITSAEELRAVVGTPMKRAAEKVRTTLDDTDRVFIARSPFQMIATSGADGSVDVSPKGDPAGSVLVLDDHRLAIADRPGNRRVDGFLNILENPQVGVIFLVPGRSDTLRVNGRARLLRDPSYAREMAHRNHVPTIVLEVTVDEVFTHCAKAFLRSNLWKPEAWPTDDLPSVARMAQRTDHETPIGELEAYYDETHYRTILYQPAPP